MQRNKSLHNKKCNTLKKEIEDTSIQKMERVPIHKDQQINIVKMAVLSNE